MTCRTTYFLAACILLSAVSGLYAARTQPAKEQTQSQVRWKFGRLADPNYFPIAVWLQSPANAEKYKKAGINLYVGLWQGPTEEQLSALKAADMPVICFRNRVAIAHKDDPLFLGWMHNDEPDNAQPVRDPATGRETYGPPVPSHKVVDDYERLRKEDPTRPVLLNLGQGVANDEWVGRGSGAKPDDYLTYVKGCDIVSFDVYPIAGLEKPNPQDYIWYVAKGVERLKKWTEGKKIVWNCIECTHIGDEKRQATPEQVRSEVWMSIIHGSTGLIYFVHQFKPRFNEHALLDDPPMLAAVTALNTQIKQLAPILNSPTLPSDGTASSLNGRVPIATMQKRHGGALWLFAVGMRNGETDGYFRPSTRRREGKVEVVGENRSLELKAGSFRDHFKPYEPHIYRITE